MEPNNNLLEAKTFFLQYLGDIIKPFSFDFFNNIYKNVKTAKQNEILKNFQIKLSEINSYNIDYIQDIYNDFINKSKCDFFQELIQIIFMSYTIVLTSLNSNKEEKIDLDVPSSSKFLYKVLLEIARRTYEKPHLFKDFDMSAVDILNNRSVFMDLVEGSIERTIRGLLPVKKLILYNLSEISYYPKSEAKPDDESSKKLENIEKQLQMLLESKTKQRGGRKKNNELKELIDDIETEGFASNQTEEIENEIKNVVEEYSDNENQSDDEKEENNEKEDKEEIAENQSDDEKEVDDEKEDEDNEKEENKEKEDEDNEKDEESKEENNKEIVVNDKTEQLKEELVKPLESKNEPTLKLNDVSGNITANIKNKIKKEREDNSDEEIEDSIATSISNSAVEMSLPASSYKKFKLVKK